jgi:hypothetical protein
MSMKGEARAAYGANNTVEVVWTIRYFEVGAEADLYIEGRMSGNRPLPAANP